MLSQKNSGQGAYRNGRKPNMLNGVPGVEHYTKKKRYHNHSLVAKMHALRELTKNFVDLNDNELYALAEEEWHELDSWDDIQNDCLREAASLPETLEEGRDG